MKGGVKKGGEVVGVIYGVFTTFSTQASLILGTKDEWKQNVKHLPKAL